MKSGLLPLRHPLAQTHAICHQYVPTGRSAALHRIARPLEAPRHVRRLFAHQARGAVPLSTLLYPSGRLLQESGLGCASSSPPAAPMCVSRTSPVGCSTLIAVLPCRLVNPPARKRRCLPPDSRRVSPLLCKARHITSLICVDLRGNFLQFYMCGQQLRPRQACFLALRCHNT